ncbi:hypothetical protein [Erythrobacter sp. KY5]|uniref:hypothetical protein n=1 Tax=Erythrobacter sp. KY5 TaxID=2011159 RepID=UPI0013A69077|nr:hypothetical protein [Erythrobacter sp. KY5]
MASSGDRTYANFYRIAAIASALSAVTTLILIFAPRFYPPMDGLADVMALVENPAYRLRAWVYLLHPFLVMTAAVGLVAAIWTSQRVLACLGLAGFGLWAATEAAQQCLTLFAYDRWRLAWLAGDEAIRATMEVRKAIYDGLWDAAYVLLIIGFFIGNLALAAAYAKGKRAEKVVALFLLLASLLTLTIIITEFGGPALLPPSLAPWIYPAVQPLGRLIIGVWLWHFASRAVSGRAFSNARI